MKDTFPPHWVHAKPGHGDVKNQIARMVIYAKKHGHGHLCGALSALPIIRSIYASMGPNDTFILSKGHACLAWYVVLEDYGHNPDVTKIHPEIDPVNGITCTTGSLGHGLPMAVGLALANRLAMKSGVVHVLMGDGECLEGTTWESLALARRWMLYDHLVVHVDDNGWQGSCAFLDPGLIDNNMSSLFPVKTYNIRKGHGLSLFEAHPDWHVHYLTDQEYIEALREVQS